MAEQEEQLSFDRVVEELQRLIDEQAQALYSDRVLEEARHPRNLGCMERPDAHAIVLGWCGDTMEIFLRLDGTNIAEAMFMTDGCGPSVACGSMMTTMARGKTLEEASQITTEDLLSALGGLPEESAHCVTLAVDTLQRAMAKPLQGAKTGPAKRRHQALNGEG